MRRGASVVFAAIVVSCTALPAAAQSAYFSASGGRQVQPPAGAARQAFPDSARIAFIDIDRVAALSAEGKAAAAKLEDLRSKKAAEAAERSKQVEALQMKVSQNASVLNDPARARLQREFQRAQIDFQRFTEDVRAEVQETQQELLQAFTARLFPVIGQVANR